MFLLNLFVAKLRLDAHNNHHWITMHLIDLL